MNTWDKLLTNDLTTNELKLKDYPYVGFNPNTHKVFYTKKYPTPEYVDLGLPSGALWMTCNLGANNPWETGLFYQWGDTQGYTKQQVIDNEKEFSWNDYKFGNSTENLTKYNATDKKLLLDIEDDAVSDIYGKKWTTPSQKIYNELFNNTTIEYVSNYQNSGCNGYLLTSNINNNTLFFPESGYIYNGAFMGIDNNTRLWTANASTSKYAHGLFASLNKNNDIPAYNVNTILQKYSGINIRGVRLQ